MNLKGILIEGRDGQEYLLGFGRQPAGPLTGPPTLSRRGADGAFQPFGNVLEASKVAMASLANVVPARITLRIGSAGWAPFLALASAVC